MNHLIAGNKGADAAADVDQSGRFEENRVLNSTSKVYIETTTTQIKTMRTHIFKNRFIQFNQLEILP